MGNTDVCRFTASPFARCQAKADSWRGERGDRGEWELDMKKYYSSLHVRGYEAPDGSRFVGVTSGGREYFISHKDFRSDRRRALQSLADQGFVLAGAAQTAEIMEQAAGLREYTKREVIREPGWTGPFFVRPNGEVLTPKAVRKTASDPAVAFHCHPHRYGCAGGKKGWCREVATPLMVDDLGSTLFGLAFAPTVAALFKTPLMPFACQIVDSNNSYYIRSLLHSIVGRMGENSLVTDPVEDLIADPSRFIENSRHSLLIIGDLGRYICGRADSRRKIALRSLLFDYLLPLPGSDMNAAGQQAPSFVVIEEQPLDELLELDDGAALKLNEAMPLIRASRMAAEPEGSQGGVCRAEPHIWQNMVGVAKRHHGAVLKAYQQGLVEVRNRKGKRAVEKALTKPYDAFRKRVGRHFGEQGVPDALINLFACAAAALSVARRLDLVPTAEASKKAEWRTLRSCLPTPIIPSSAASILAEIASRDDVIMLNDIKSTTKKRKLERAPAFIKRHKDGRRELWVTTEQKKQLFDWPSFSRLHDFKDLYCGKGEKDRHGSKRVIGAWKNARVLRFRLSDG